jgi:hypothetical protein
VRGEVVDEQPRRVLALGLRRLHLREVRLRLRRAHRRRVGARRGRLRRLRLPDAHLSIGRQRLPLRRRHLGARRRLADVEVRRLRGRDRDRTHRRLRDQRGLRIGGDEVVLQLGDLLPGGGSLRRGGLPRCLGLGPLTCLLRCPLRCCLRRTRAVVANLHGCPPSGAGHIARFL